MIKISLAKLGVEYKYWKSFVIQCYCYSSSIHINIKIYISPIYISDGDILFSVLFKLGRHEHDGFVTFIQRRNLKPWRIKKNNDNSLDKKTICRANKNFINLKSCGIYNNKRIIIYKSVFLMFDSVNRI